MSSLHPFLNHGNIAGKTFAFRNDADGHVNLHFHPDGRVTGGHQNESHWIIDNGILVLQDHQHHTSCRFTDAKSIDGKLQASGLFSLPFDGTKGWRHHLFEVLPYISHENVVGKSFFFRNENCGPARHTLNADHSIGGAGHPNESRWGFENGNLVYFAADGRASCRFSEAHVVEGKLQLSGLYLLGGAPNGWRHFLHEEGSYSLNPNVVTESLHNKRFSFRSDGGHIADVTLLPGGAIGGYGNENESRWSCDHGKLIFHHRDGHPSTEFNNVYSVGGKLHFGGLFLLPNPPTAGWRHYMNEL